MFTIYWNLKGFAFYYYSIVKVLFQQVALPIKRAEF